MYYAYLLRLSSGNYYSGFSSNLRQRIEAHKKGDVTQTRNHRPLELVFYAAFQNKLKALGFEKYLKSSSGFAFRNKRLV